MSSEVTLIVNSVPFGDLQRAMSFLTPANGPRWVENSNGNVIHIRSEEQLGVLVQAIINCFTRLGFTQNTDFSVR